MAPAIARGHSFARDERGVTAVEFAILALPFFTIILAILQTALVFLAQQVLDSALQDASRLVKTGQAQSGSSYGSTSLLRSYMCDFLFGLMDCNQVILLVTPINDFASTQINQQVQDCNYTDPAQPKTCTWKTTLPAYNAGSGQTIEQVSAYYRYPLVVVLPYFNIKNQPDNYRLISAIRVFRNEPFS